MVSSNGSSSEGDGVTDVLESEPDGRQNTSFGRVDSLYLEAGRIKAERSKLDQAGWLKTLYLAFQSIGVVYGDMGTSPLYTFSSTFPNGIKETEDILGALSLIIYTIILIPTIKYVLIVLWANDNGDGGTFALYSLICRYANVSLIPNHQAEDVMLSNYQLEIPSRQMKRAEWIKEKLESCRAAKIILFLMTILGTSMVLGDGILTPAISVLSAVGGIKTAASSLNQDAIVWISVAILIMLFMVQRLGTDKVGYTFAPIVFVWFAFIGCTGIYNIVKHNISILRAFNPAYIVRYFERNGKQGWISLGGIILCITGTEAMFADLGHFNIRAIQVSYISILLPSVSLAYAGQAAYLSKFPEHVADTFYKSLPDQIYWPTFVVAVAAAVIASQAMISGAFSIISQSVTLGCFPSVKVVHTSAKYEGQIYIPEINYGLMIACVLVTLIFRTTEQIGNAYGIAVLTVMFLTTVMVSLIMLVIWKTNMWMIALFLVTFGSAEIVYISSALYKFVSGGYLPLCFALFMMSTMAMWHYVYRKRYIFELKNKVSKNYLTELANNPNVRRIPGIGLLYSDLVHGIPPIFSHFVESIPSIHSVLVFVSIKHIPINRVAIEERFLFRQLDPREYRMFRCIVRYGYNDSREEPKEFERLLVENLKDFINHDNVFQERTVLSEKTKEMSLEGARSIAGVVPLQGVEEEKQFIQQAMENGVVYFKGEAEVVAKPNSSFCKKLVVNYIYSFLKRNFREGDTVTSVPRGKLLRVGMTYEI